MLADPFSEAVEHGLDVVALAKLYEDLGRWDSAARLFERGLEMELPEADFWLAISAGTPAETPGTWRRLCAYGNVRGQGMFTPM